MAIAWLSPSSYASENHHVQNPLPSTMSERFFLLPGHLSMAAVAVAWVFQNSCAFEKHYFQKPRPLAMLSSLPQALLESPQRRQPPSLASTLHPVALEPPAIGVDFSASLRM